MHYKTATYINDLYYLSYSRQLSKAHNMITIKKATTTDAATIAEIGETSFIESHGHSAPKADIAAYVARKYTTDVLHSELKDTRNIYHIIYWKGQPAGYSKIILNTPNNNISANNITSLDRLYLLKEFYDLKLGRELFTHNVALSRQAQQAGIWLYTWTENSRAINFYTKAGFKIVGSAQFKISDTHANPNHVMYLDYSNKQ